MPSPLKIRSSGLSRAAQAVAGQLANMGLPIVSRYMLYGLIANLFENREGLFLRGLQMSRAEYARIKNGLLAERILAEDSDYARLAFRVISVPDAPADEICCIVDPTCHVSYLSAMQRYGLTDRRPESLQIARPKPNAGHGKKNPDERLIPFPKAIKHPETVRGRKIALYEFSGQARSITLRGTRTRIVSIGRCFVDMLLEPQRCGGMQHVLVVWEEHAAGFKSEIIKEVDSLANAAIKVRAGYILEERLGLQDAVFTSWQKLATMQTWGRLDPDTPANPMRDSRSKRWEIIINA